MKLEYISFSRLETYTACPQKYFFLYESGLREDPHPAAVLGNIIHYALERFIGHNEDWRKAYDESYKDLNLNDFSLYKEGIAIIESVIKRGLVRDDVKVLATEKAFEFITSNGVRLKGIIDRIDRISDDTIEIVDYKSGKKIYTDAELEANMQANIYSIAIFDYLYPDIKNLIITFDFLRFGRLTTIRTREQLDDIKKYLLLMQTKIEKDYSHNANVSFKCNWCSFRPICDAKKKKIERPISNIKDLEISSDIEIVDQIYEYDMRSKYFDDKSKYLKDYLKEKMIHNNYTEIKTKQNKFSLVSKKQYKINENKLKQILLDKKIDIEKIKSIDMKKLYQLISKDDINENDFKEIDTYNLSINIKNIKNKEE